MVALGQQEADGRKQADRPGEGVPLKPEFKSLFKYGTAAVDGATLQQPWSFSPSLIGKIMAQTHLAA